MTEFHMSTLITGSMCLLVVPNVNSVREKSDAAKLLVERIRKYGFFGGTVP